MLGMGVAPGWLPPFNTGLIVISGLFLITGYVFIRRGQRTAHQWSMLTATTFAALFLVVYVTRALLFETKPFGGEGLVRVAYFTVLTSHTILATVVGPMVLIAVYRALKGQFKQHRRIARLTLPTWLYVVASGWIIFAMLYL